MKIFRRALFAIIYGLTLGQFIWNLNPYLSHPRPRGFLLFMSEFAPLALLGWTVVFLKSESTLARLALITFMMVYGLCLLSLGWSLFSN